MIRFLIILPISFPLKNCLHHLRLQLHIEQIIEKEHEVHSHVAYEYFRSYFHGNMDAIEERLTLLMEVGGTGADSAAEAVDQLLKADTLSNNKFSELAVLMENMGMPQEALKIETALVAKAGKQVDAADTTTQVEYALWLNDMGAALDAQGKYEDAMAKFPKGFTTIKPYLRVTPQPNK